jgi:hypothetical protein
MLTMLDENRLMEIGRKFGPKVYDQLFKIKSTNQKVIYLIEYFKHRGRLAELLAAVFKNNKEDSTRLNPDIPVEKPNDLSPPIVNAPIYECTRAVVVDSFTPGALVQVYSNGTEVVGSATPHYGFDEIELTRPLSLGEIITATQTVNEIESLHSHTPVEVSALPDFPSGRPPAPCVISPIFACGRVVGVAELVPGARVIVNEDGVDIGSKNTANDRESVLTASLTDGKVVKARQLICQDVTGMSALESPSSDGLTVLPVPDPFEGPKLEEDSVVVGNNSVTLDGLYVGALVKVRNGTTVVGSGYATGSRNWVPLSDAIEASWVVGASQELCGSHAPAEPVTPTTRLDAPQIIGPVCDTDQTVRVGKSVLNATVALFRNGNLAGLAGAQPNEFVMSIGGDLAAGDELTVLQYMGPTVSPLSDPVYVCPCSEIPGLIHSILDSAGGNSPHLPIASSPSTVPILTNADPFDVIDLTLRADFEMINKETLAEDAVSDGHVIYVDQVTGHTVEVPCRISARGNTRFTYCGWRPLKLKFDGDPNGTIFEGTGKVIKIVTHCGFKSGDQWILGGTNAQHNRRLLQEFALYQVLAAMETAALDTRLAMITYQDPNGATLETRYGFVREREKRAAERCGCERLELDEGDTSLPPNPTSDFQVRFHHKFLFSHDYAPAYEHNCVRMGLAGEEYYFPYDFDLSGAIRPEYFKNNGWTIEENGEELINWLRAFPDQNLVKVQIAALLSHEDAMRERAQGGPVDNIGRARLEYWFEDHIRRLKCFLAEISKRKSV